MNNICCWFAFCKWIVDYVVVRMDREAVIEWRDILADDSEIDFVYDFVIPSKEIKRSLEFCYGESGMASFIKYLCE